MARKLELVNAEGLFGLDTTEYPELQRVVSEMKKLGRIYDLYQEQRDFEDGNSATPWGDLDVSSLQRGVEVLEKKARKEKQFKEHPTFRAVEARIFNFKDSIPLIVNLKNDAMKPRHWQKLIEVSENSAVPINDVNGQQNDARRLQANTHKQVETAHTVQSYRRYVHLSGR